ncbi:MAG: thioredoxin domain-containing protein [Archangium sp.]
MNRIALISLFVATAVFAEDLAPADWKARAEKGDVLILDVRTPGEVAKGKIANASVIDFNGGNFEKKVALMSREKPVLVYCASGGRSSRAMELMTKLGFKHVDNLSGGMRAWQAAGYAVDTSASGAAVGSGEVTTPENFDALIKKEKRVLVDFQTPWCTPCQKMSPIFDSLALKGVATKKVDIDASEALASREKIEGVPVFVLYVDGKEKARLSGEQTKAALEALAR